MRGRSLRQKIESALRIKNYVSNIVMKLGLSRRAEVAAFIAKRRRGGDAQDWSSRAPTRRPAPNCRLVPRLFGGKGRHPS
jgi:hypothetical protein